MGGHNASGTSRNAKLGLTKQRATLGISEAAETLQNKVEPESFDTGGAAMHETPVTNKKAFDERMAADEKEVQKARDAGMKVSIGVVLHDGSRVLLGRATGLGKWDLPKGGGDPGEKLLDTCKREVLEETGIDMDKSNFSNVQPLGLFDYHKNYKKVYLFSVKADKLPDVSELHCDSTFKDYNGKDVPELDGFDYVDFDKTGSRVSSTMDKVLKEALPKINKLHEGTSPKVDKSPEQKAAAQKQQLDELDELLNFDFGENQPGGQGRIELDLPDIDLDEEPDNPIIKSPGDKTKETLSKQPDTGFPTDISQIKPVKNLGGTTGAMLVNDQAGQPFVMKKGNSEGHLLNEGYADSVYRAFGADVPEFKIMDSPKGKVKLAKLIPNTKSLASVLYSGNKPLIDSVKQQLQKNFIVDAVLGGWDVAGWDNDNVLVDAQGKPWRIDNGCSFEYRAQGAKKNPTTPMPNAMYWDEYPMEIFDMRNPNHDKKYVQNAAGIFKDLSIFDVAKQAKELIGSSYKDKLAQANIPDKERNMLTKRIQNLGYLADYIAKEQAAGKSAKDVEATARAMLYAWKEHNATLDSKDPNSSIPHITASLQKKLGMLQKKSSGDNKPGASSKGKDDGFDTGSAAMIYDGALGFEECMRKEGFADWVLEQPDDYIDKTPLVDVLEKFEADKVKK